MITGLLLPVAAHAQVSYTGSASVSVNPGTATHLVIPGGPEPFYTAFSFNIYAYDAEGNLATSYNGTVAFTSSDPGFVNLGSPGTRGSLPARNFPRFQRSVGRTGALDIRLPFF